jgi:hypothetical protein
MLGTRAELTNEQIMSLFRPVEGQIAVYYGKIRNGKTYAATADIIELVKRGETVYANWQVDIADYDERNHFYTVLIKFLFGKNLFFKYKSSSFHYFHPDDIDIPFLGRLVNAHIFIDEGQWIFNSHTKDHDPEKRKLIFHNGHYCRSLNIITQRPVNIFKDMRSQVHIWYKCEKKLNFPLMFQKTQFEDMKDDLPDETVEKPPVQVYMARNRVLRAYNTHAMRANDAELQVPDFEAYTLTYMQMILTMYDMTLGKAINSAYAALAARRNRPSPSVSPGRITSIKKPSIGDTT